MRKNSIFSGFHLQLLIKLSYFRHAVVVEDQILRVELAIYKIGFVKSNTEDKNFNANDVRFYLFRKLGCFLRNASEQPTSLLPRSTAK